MRSIALQSRYYDIFDPLKLVDVAIYDIKSLNDIYDLRVNSGGKWTGLAHSVKRLYNFLYLPKNKNLQRKFISLRKSLKICLYSLKTDIISHFIKYLFVYIF